MLRNNLALIVQHLHGGRYICQGFRALRLTSSGYVAFNGATSTYQHAAHFLGDAFCDELLRYEGAQEELAMPCSRLSSASFTAESSH